MKEFWSTEARNILKGLLAREDSTYKVLAKRLEHIGVKENADQLRNKINRGTFSFAFFLKCLHALGQTEARITVKRPKSTPREKQP